MSKVVLSIGSNMGDSLGYLRSMHHALGDTLLQASSIYATKPWGFTQQADFLNAVLIADDSTKTVQDWLIFAQDLEQQAERKRVFKNGPRTLDVDLISGFAEGKPIFSDTPELILPHPRAVERLFVLVPWLQADPEALWFASAASPAIPVATILGKFSAADLAEVTLTDYWW